MADQPRIATAVRPNANPAPQPDWVSPLWGRPDTVAVGSLRTADDPSPASAPSPDRPRQRPRARLIAAGVALGVVAAVLLNNALTGPSTSNAGRRPKVSPSPAAPTPRPSLPTPTPTPSSNGQPGSQSQPNAPGLSTAQQAAVAAVSPGLVDIVTTVGSDGAHGAGTGVVLTAQGIVLTNHHVVAGATSVSVTDVGNGRTYGAKVLGYDRTHDIAVLRMAGASGLATAPLGDSTTVSVGDQVVALGNALGSGGAPTAAAGTVTALNQSITARDSSGDTAERLSGLIQVNAAIQPGDSGGALANVGGQVIGIITAGSDTDLADQTATQGFAVPISTAHKIADQIVGGRSSGEVHIGETAFLGISLSSASASSRGLVVAGSVSGSPAAHAGIVAGDVVTSVDGHNTTTLDALRRQLDAFHPGDRLRVTWSDGHGNSQSQSLTLTDGPTG
jgi:S1-C subfamily serine protease